MKIGLLLCSKTTASSNSRGFGHTRLIEQWLDPVAKGKVSLRSFRVYEGKLPPKLDSCDCYIVSGSSSSVLDNNPWIAELNNFLLVAAKAQIPVIGICFGHQALAKALGGHVKYADQGWELGVKSWKVVRQEGWMRECGKYLSLISAHREQVDKLPPRSVRVAASDACPNGVFRLANHAIGIQGHPESTLESITHFIESNKRLFTAELRKNALASLDQPTQSREMAKWCINFVMSRA